ncbi:hypothetical protein GUJ93_ZPchr0008g13731 [Zizania palustris]|uniref:Esterase n=1 Tax=Zizania palustris TaxID=103762 RepID=A0A8J5R4C9_ZIZPA|nr:hypothetical protein GUJ93_ZPchr0008g13731 [Zizania palustris]
MPLVGRSAAEKLGLPFVPPFLAHNGGSFRQGANFAVAGATALNASFFRDIPGVGSFVLNTSSSVQLGWFDSLKPSLCSPAQECVGFFHNSLFFMGEFGVNDYSFSFFGKTLPEVRSMVPDVVKAIKLATKRLIKQTRAKDALFNVRINHPDVRVVYADFFTPVIRIVESPATFGFTSDILRCCCGGGGKYNFNTSAGCGMAGSTVCDYPATYLFWDGHMTEAAYRIIANAWLNSINTS